jgi:hypothetical protein
MTKIVTDQIQRREGPELTLPIKDGAAGSPLLTDGRGNLYFQGQTATAGSTAAVVTTLADKDIPGLVAPEGKGMVGRIVSHDSWQNHCYNDSLGQPSSSAAWTTYYNYSPYSDNSAIQFINMLLGDGYANSGSSEFLFGNRGQSHTARTLQFSNGNRLGHDFNLSYPKNVQSYPGYSFACMPIRNTSSAAISVSLYSQSSNYWSSGYEGRCLFYFRPNSSNYGKKYSEVTTVEGVLITDTNYSGNGAQYTQSGTISVPANTTILVCQTSSDWYYTTYQYTDLNYFYNLNTTFTNPNIICDMRMLSTLHKSRFSTMSYTGSIASHFHKIWNQCGTDFGDR